MSSEACRGDAIRDWVEQFEGPERVLWQKPAEVIGSLNLQRGARVADLGAGAGYFTIALARAVGSKGRVYAIELDPALVAHVARRAELARARAVRPILGTADDPKIPEPVDIVFTCNTYHHLKAQPSYFERLRANLRPDGRIVVIDWHKRLLPIGPPIEVKRSAREVLRTLTAAGLRFQGRETFLPYQYLLCFV